MSAVCLATSLPGESGSSIRLEQPGARRRQERFFAARFKFHGELEFALATPHHEEAQYPTAPHARLGSETFPLGESKGSVVPSAVVSRWRTRAVPLASGHDARDA